MQGLELARLFYEEHRARLFDGIPAAIRERSSIGLVGEGSECFGFDDAYSRDHDWGAGFCIWLSADDFREYGSQFESNYERLCEGDFCGYPLRSPKTEQGAQRLGVFSSNAFYQQLLGISHVPNSIGEWLPVSETSLATATNGSIFQPGGSGFVEMRNALLRYYPEDLRLKKIASGCLVMAQSGQYNFPREIKRNDLVAAYQALDRFMEATMALVYSLNKRFRPYYKWAHRGLGLLASLGVETCENIATLVDLFQRREYERAIERIEDICISIVGELYKRELTDTHEAFLMPQALQVNSRIKDAALRTAPISTSISL